MSDYNQELEKALGGLKEGLEKKTQDLFEKLKAEVDAAIKEKDAAPELEGIKSTMEEVKAHNEALQKHLDELDIAVQKKSGQDLENMHPVARYYHEMKQALNENLDGISQVMKTGKFSMEIKAPMTLALNLTGDPIKTYNETPVTLQSQRVNFADLVPNIQSRTGVYTYYVENAVTGAPDFQTEGSAKEELGFNLTETIVNVSTLAGYTRVSNQMLTDLPFLQSFLPGALRREYFKAENAAFYTALSTAATGTSTATGGVTGIIEDIGVLEAGDYDVTGIVVNPATWSELAATQIPGETQSAVVSFVNNQMSIAGVPVFKASWVPADAYLMGDWFWCKKLVVDGLSVRFFEQDQDNAIKNLVTVRIESRTNVAVEKPAAFLLGSVVAAT